MPGEMERVLVVVQAKSGGSREIPAGGDVLSLVNELDDAWHEQPRSFEREAVARFWALLTFPARLIDPVAPSRMLRSATVLRNVRFQGQSVKEMFFANKDFTELDALFLQVGTSLGHAAGDGAWVVEVERKSGNQHSDYYLAVQRAKKFAEFLNARMGIRARPVVIYEDDAGRISYQRFDGEVLLLDMGSLRRQTRALRFQRLEDIPGLAGDRTLAKLALMRQLVAQDPNHPGWYGGPLTLARTLETRGDDLRLPVVGHMDTERVPESLEKWLRVGKESDQHLEERIQRYLRELQDANMLAPGRQAPRLSLEGGQAVLRLANLEREERT